MWLLFFPGQGSQYMRTSRALYKKYPTIKSVIDRGFEKIQTKYGIMIESAFFNEPGDTHPFVNQTQFSQVTTFIYSYALALFFQEIGVVATAMIGHSVGEYVAACLADVFSFEEGIEILMERGKLMGTLPEGKMIALRTKYQTIEEFLKRYPNVSLAAENTPEDFVLAGNVTAIEKITLLAKEWKILVFSLNTSHAFHSKDVISIKESLFAMYSKIPFKKPKHGYISNLTGSWIDPAEVITPTYWTRHSCEKVQFSKGIQCLLEEGVQVFIEVGPSKILTSLISKQLPQKTAHRVLSCVDHPSEGRFEEEALFGLLQQLWLNGIEIDWDKLYQDKPRKTPLPTYSFDRFYFWKFGALKKHRQKTTQSFPTLTHKTESINLFTPVWKPISSNTVSSKTEIYWILHQGSTLDQFLINKLKEKGKVIEFDCSSDKDTNSLLGWCCDQTKRPTELIYTIDNESCSTTEVGTFIHKMDRYFYPFLEVIKFLGNGESAEPTSIRVIANGIASMTVSEHIDPTNTIMAAFLRSLSIENANLKTQLIDFNEKSESLELLLQVLDSEIQEGETSLSEIAIREEGTFRLSFESCKQEKNHNRVPFVKNGIYLITGGLGGIGLIVGEYLAKQVQAHVILSSRSIHEGKSASKLKEIKEYARSLEIVKLDVGDADAVQKLISSLYQRYGHIHGIIHLAGIPDEGLIRTKTKKDFERVFRSKILGSINLVQAIKHHSIKPDIILFGSSIASVVPGIGQSAYAMANHFLNAFAKQCRQSLSLPTMSINWDTWRETGMARKYEEAINNNPEHTNSVVNKIINLHTERDWILIEHRIKGYPVLPGTAFIAIIIKEMALKGYPIPIEIRSIHFIQPLILQDEQSVDVRLTITPTESAYFNFSFHKSTANEQNSSLLCEGVLVLAKAECKASYEKVEYEKKRVFSETHALKQTNTIMQFGPRWNNVKQVCYSDKHEGIATINLAEGFQSDFDQYSIHPAILDTATSFLIDLFYPEITLIPHAYENLIIHKPLVNHLFSHAVLLNDSDTLSFRVRLFDSNEQCCLECEVIFKKINSDNRLESENQNYTLTLGKGGDLTTLQYLPCQRKAILDDEIEFETIATGLNFKEILYSLGLIPNLSTNHVYQFGLEASGIVTKVGSHVTRLKPGDPVMGMVSGGFNRFVCAKKNQLVLKPNTISFEEAASHSRCLSYRISCSCGKR